MTDVTTNVRSLDEVKALLAKRTNEKAAADVVTAKTHYQYIRPFAAAADGLIEFVQNPEGRFMLGLHEVDAKTRGFGKGELVYVTGRAHSGKTQVVLNALNHNHNANILYFTPDEVAELILSKLVAIRHGLNSEYVEQRIKADDQEIIDLVRQTAVRDFPNLIVIDDSLNMDQMTRALEEARDFWGADADAVCIDFLELIPGGEGDANGVSAKSQELKRWSKKVDLPVICLHQASRSSGQRGQAAGMNAMRYGGETEATFVLEVFRKREDESLDNYDRTVTHANTVTVNVDKNKRPPCKRGEVDLFMDPDTGVIRELRPGDQSMTQQPLPDRLREVLAR